MIIEEKDFKIKREHDSFVLYLLKNKKELKEDSVDKYKIGGYFIKIESAMKEVVRFRKDKKYTGGESFKILQRDIHVFLDTKKLLDTLINSVYYPLIELKKKLFIYE